MNLSSRAFGSTIEYISLIPIIEYFNHECTVNLKFLLLINVIRLLKIFFYIKKIIYKKSKIFNLENNKIMLNKMKMKFQVQISANKNKI